jgi:DNA gyrase subunit A
MGAVRPGSDDTDDALLVVTDGGFGKRTRLSEYKRQGRGGQGVLTARIEEKRGQLVGALIVQDTDEIFCITSSGVVIRMSVSPLRFLSRPTGGVKLVALDAGATVVAVAHNGEAAADAVTEAVTEAGPGTEDGAAERSEGDLTQDEVSMGQTPADDAGLDVGPADGAVPEEPSTEGTDEGGSA